MTFYSLPNQKITFMIFFPLPDVFILYQKLTQKTHELVNAFENRQMVSPFDPHYDSESDWVHFSFEIFERNKTLLILITR